MVCSFERTIAMLTMSLYFPPLLFSCLLVTTSAIRCGGATGDCLSCLTVFDFKNKSLARDVVGKIPKAGLYRTHCSRTSGKCDASALYIFAQKVESAWVSDSFFVSCCSSGDNCNPHLVGQKLVRTRYDGRNYSLDTHTPLRLDNKASVSKFFTNYFDIPRSSFQRWPGIYRGSLLDCADGKFGSSCWVLRLEGGRVSRTATALDRCDRRNLRLMCGLVGTGFVSVYCCLSSQCNAESQANHYVSKMFFCDTNSTWTAGNATSTSAKSVTCLSSDGNVSNCASCLTSLNTRSEDYLTSTCSKKPCSDVVLLSGCKGGNSKVHCCQFDNCNPIYKKPSFGHFGISTFYYRKLRASELEFTESGSDLSSLFKLEMTSCDGLETNVASGFVRCSDEGSVIKAKSCWVIQSLDGSTERLGLPISCGDDQKLAVCNQTKNAGYVFCCRRPGCNFASAAESYLTQMFACDSVQRRKPPLTPVLTSSKPNSIQCRRVHGVLENCSSCLTSFKPNSKYTSVKGYTQLETFLTTECSPRLCSLGTLRRACELHEDVSFAHCCETPNCNPILSDKTSRHMKKDMFYWKNRQATFHEFSLDHENLHRLLGIDMKSCQKVKAETKDYVRCSEGFYGKSCWAHLEAGVVVRTAKDAPCNLEMKKIACQNDKVEWVFCCHTSECNARFNVDDPLPLVEKCIEIKKPFGSTALYRA